MAVGVFFAYVVVFIGLSSTSGIAYENWFDSGANAFRTAVIPLIGGSLVLAGFVWWARWDWVFKDPVRLPLSGFLRVPLVLFAVGIVVHFAVADWSRVTADLLLAVLAAGVLVGFAEETLFRGASRRAPRPRLARHRSYRKCLAAAAYGRAAMRAVMAAPASVGGAGRGWWPAMSAKMRSRRTARSRRTIEFLDRLR